MRDGVQSETSQEAGGGVAILEGHIAVGHLMDHDGKKENHGHQGHFQELGKT
jgi:hypothetical protein